MKGGGLSYDGVESFATLVDENKILDEGDFFAHLSVTFGAQTPMHGGEDCYSFFLKLFVGGELGVGTFEVAHGEPFFLWGFALG